MTIFNPENQEHREILKKSLRTNGTTEQAIIMFPLLAYIDALEQDIIVGAEDYFKLEEEYNELKHRMESLEK